MKSFLLSNKFEKDVKPVRLRSLFSNIQKEFELLWHIVSSPAGNSSKRSLLLPLTEVFAHRLLLQPNCFHDGILHRLGGGSTVRHHTNVQFSKPLLES